MFFGSTDSVTNKCRVRCKKETSICYDLFVMYLNTDEQQCGRLIYVNNYNCCNAGIGCLRLQLLYHCVVLRFCFTLLYTYAVNMNASLMLDYPNCLNNTIYLNKHKKSLQAMNCSFHTNVPDELLPFNVWARWSARCNDL